MEHVSIIMLSMFSSSINDQNKEPFVYKRVSSHLITLLSLDPRKPTSYSYMGAVGEVIQLQVPWYVSRYVFDV